MGEPKRPSVQIGETRDMDQLLASELHDEEGTGFTVIKEPDMKAEVHPVAFKCTGSTIIMWFLKRMEFEHGCAFVAAVAVRPRIMRSVIAQSHDAAIVEFLSFGQPYEGASEASP